VLARELAEELNEQARLARGDIFLFYDFVLQKVETEERVRIRDAPQHALMLEFLMTHSECAMEGPVGIGKSYVALAYTLFRIGSDPTTRGAIVSSTEMQAAKTTNLVRKYIDTSKRLRMVFPDLRRSEVAGDPWTKTELTVARPANLKDPTLTAYGVDQDAILGSRLNWMLGDDILDTENTTTPEQRKKIRDAWQQKCLSRRSPNDRTWKAALINTPWHVDDAIEHALRPPKDDGTGGLGWPGLRMDAYGDIEIIDGQDVAAGRAESWDSDRVRPSHPGTSDPHVRLVANDPDPDNKQTLWPHRWPSSEDVDRERQNTPDPVVFNRNFRSRVRDDETAMCPSSYVQRCYAQGRALGVRGFASSLASARGGPFLFVFTGVDPAFTTERKSDFSSIFTFGVREDGIKVILELTFGRWSPPLLARNVADVVARFDSLVAIESNSGGDVLISFMRNAGVTFSIKPQRTGSEKWSPEHGVATFFSEMEQGDWAWPYGRPPAIVKLDEDCVNYVPVRHTPDTLMSSFVARKLAKKWGVLNGKGPKAAARAAENAQRHSAIRKRMEANKRRIGGGGIGDGGGMAAMLLAR
jgi:Terminase RNaseH-like domain